MSAQQSADRGGADPDPELAQLALDPHVAPARILPREPHDDRAELGIDGRATDLRAAVRPLRRTSSRCQRSRVCGVTRKDDHRSRGSRRAAAARKARSIGRSCGRLAWRRSTRSWWRRTAISTSLEASSDPELGTSPSRRRSTRYRIDKTTGGDPTDAGCSGCKSQF
jgi:hypothetical protein